MLKNFRSSVSSLVTYFFFSKISVYEKILGYFRSRALTKIAMLLFCKGRLFLAAMRCNTYNTAAPKALSLSFLHFHLTEINIFSKINHDSPKTFWNNKNRNSFKMTFLSFDARS